MTRNIFRFFDLPKEIRDMIYGNLVNESRVKHALVRPPPYQEVTRLSFACLWLPHLLLIDKLFMHEYFDHVCSHRLQCYYGVNESLTSAEVFISDQSATACLSRVRILIFHCTVFHSNANDLNIDVYNSAIDKTIPTLVRLLPHLKTVEGRVSILTITVDEIYRRRNEGLLRDFHPDNTRFETALLNHGVSRKIKHERLHLFHDWLCYDLDTRKPSRNRVITYVARWATAEDKQEHLWHGFALEGTSVTRARETV